MSQKNSFCYIYPILYFCRCQQASLPFLFHFSSYEKTRPFNHLLQTYFVLRYSFFFYMGFLSRPCTSHRTAGEEGGHFYNSSLPLPPALQRFRHQPSDCCRNLTSAHRQQPDSNQESSVSERKSLTTKLLTTTPFLYRLKT